MSAPRHTARLSTLAFVQCERDVLLLRHPQTSDRFRGLWNGIGGHVEAGEGLHAAARRELREETGLDLASLRLRALIHETGMVGAAYVVFVFVAEVGDRRIESPEGLELAWHPIDGLSRLPLVADVAQILPSVLEAEEPIFLTERYDGGDDRLAIHFEEAPGRPR